MGTVKAIRGYPYGKRWFFTPLDKACLKMVIKGTWLFQGRLDASLLETSLVRLLEFYPHLAGRISGDGCIEMNNEGVDFAVKRSGAAIKDVERDKCAIDRYSTGIDLRKAVKGEAPLMAVTVTLLKDGSVLSVHCAHVCLDGDSFYNMVRNWGMLARGESIVPPVIDQSLFPVADAALSREVALETVKSAGWYNVTLASLRGKIFREIMGLERRSTGALHIPSRVIDKARESITESGGTEYGNHALIAAIIAKMCLALTGIEPGKMCSVLSVVNLRGRIKSIPREFVGNAVTNIDSVHFPAGAPLGDIAAAVDVELKGTIDRPQALEDHVLLNLYAMKYTLPFVSFDLSGMNAKKPTTIYLNNFSRFPMYDIDFGGGRPVRNVPHDLPDAVKVFPAPDGDGVDVYLAGQLAGYYNRLGKRGESWLESFLAELVLANK